MMLKCYKCNRPITNKNIWCERKTTKRGIIFRYRCSHCNITFSKDNPFFRKVYSPETISLSLALKYTGVSYREIEDILGMSERTVRRWFVLFGKLLLNKFKRKIILINNIHLDELFLKMRGKFYYIWSGIDATSKWIFADLTYDRTKASAKALLQNIPPPNKIYTDNCFSYWQPIRDRYGVYFKNKNHIICTGDEKYKNNQAERLQNEFRRWLHHQRGFAFLDSGKFNIKIYEMFHNWLRRHMTLQNQTPAQVQGFVRYYEKQTLPQRIVQLIYQAYKNYLKFLTVNVLTTV
jgi:transposase-like protein